ncbi:hypothetical protein C8A05DRAFT_15442 [Staphylotrichum tortipilum]|uniref:Heterokaryon incompatibility domain-containing protein n=1 Tax=Staphylotrichum tortipilum TaxID=2831512 RepID=A0AAN6MKC1_9PEZI|nr:hypothetical protein C8A05DRAFT_15442 [Staphylotrichum longicolle]
MSLPVDTAKLQSNALAKVLDMVDVTPDVLAKTFKDVGESPEKLRALLNLWFVPWFKPTFVADPDYSGAGFRDVDFSSNADLPPGQRPYRMFDMETGNLIDFPSIGVRGQYCMLSHRWKGVELTLGYIRDARRKELERAREAIKEGKAAKGRGKKSDVEVVLEQSRMDVEEQEGLIRELYDEEGGPVVSIGELLDRRLRVRAAEDNVGWARESEDQASSRLRSTQVEQKIFSQLIDEIHEQVDEKLEQHLGKSEGATRRPAGNAVGSEVVAEAQAKLKAAVANLQNAEAQREAARDGIDYFKRHYHLRDALDQLISRLQMWKSAIKLERSIREAGHIFKTKLFQDREKCYLWTDTCCIDKTNGGELSESLSLMGDWYADAEFTLVQIDTPFREADAGKDWYRFDAERNGVGPEASDAKPNLQAFYDIKDYHPEWSTRAWTLQELVMSRTTFYVNSAWTPLSRPVESLGYFYHLMPFIALYTRGDTRNLYRMSGAAAQGFWVSQRLQEILGDEKASAQLKLLRDNIQGGQVPSSKESGKGPAERVETAQQLIALLEAVGVRIPSTLASETSTSELSRAVYLAAADLANDTTSKEHAIFLRLQQHLPLPDPTHLHSTLTGAEQTEEVAHHAINFLMQCLVAETEDLILADRRYVAEFGLVEQLDTWKQGTVRTGFSAQSVLEVSGKRKATVATDRSYALMGVLGVRFPTFPAEGYAKALARLLDEVVVTRNDISVFNWTGMEMGSPIRGRSMYPSSHTAYGNLEDRGRRYNLLLSARVQDKMEDVVATYHSVIQTLRIAIDSLKDRERKNLPLGWVERIVQLVQLHSFRELRHQQDAFGKIVGYIAEHCRKEREWVAREKEAEEKRKAEAAATPTTATPATGGFSMLKKPTLPSVPVPSFSLGSKGASPTTKEPGSAPETKSVSKFGLGKTIKAPSFGFSKKAVDPPPTKEPAAPEPAATPPPAPAPEPAPEFTPEPTSNPPPPYTEKPSAPSWHALNDEVMTYLSTPTSPLPAALASIPSPTPHPTFHLHPTSTSTTSSPTPSTTSPNPIILTTSGITSLFDIQRVLITMLDAPALRRQVAQHPPHSAAKISGWCAISTGFARVITSFSCAPGVLAQELDVIESVESGVLREGGKERGEKRGEQLRRSVRVAAVGGEGAGDGEEEEGEVGSTEEERLVSRMIEFVQTPRLEVVAGEWVLARFSGAPGAAWFLCHLELGPGPGEFYGRRIATGAIDFCESTPEPGLVNAWQTYMERKKRKMCYILGDYLRSRMSGREGEEKLKAGSELARHGVDTAVKGAGGFGFGFGSGSGSSGAKTAVAGEVEGNKAGESDDGSDDEKDGGESVFSKVLGQGKLAAKALGEYTVLSVTEKLFEMRADHLDSTLATVVLKRTPKSLRTAVENMEDNKSFLPAMFHSSTRVHMF